MAKEVALQVAMRCRPFSEDNAKLGVMCDETGDQKVVITRPFNAFQATAFNHCWWSAFNYENHLKEQEDKVHGDRISKVRRSERGKKRQTVKWPSYLFWKSIFLQIR